MKKFKPEGALKTVNVIVKGNWKEAIGRIIGDID